MASGNDTVIPSRIELMAERLVDPAGLRAGEAVLDVATGTGNAAIAAASRGCDLTGLDRAEALPERGREGAAAEGLSVNFVRGTPTTCRTRMPRSTRCCRAWA